MLNFIDMMFIVVVTFVGTIGVMLIVKWMSGRNVVDELYEMFEGVVDNGVEKPQVQVGVESDMFSVPVGVEDNWWDEQYNGLGKEECMLCEEGVCQCGLGGQGGVEGISEGGMGTPGYGVYEPSGPSGKDDK